MIQPRMVWFHAVLGSRMLLLLWLVGCRLFPQTEAFSMTSSGRSNHNHIHNHQTPEHVVQQQLAALQECNVSKAFDYNSPSNQQVTGPWPAFAVALTERPFGSILGHVEASVLLTISHQQGDYVCCLVKIVPRKQPLPASFWEAIQKEANALGMDVVVDPTDADEEDDDKDDDDEASSDHPSQLPPYSLYWWEVSKQQEEDNENASQDGCHYKVDSILPDAEDLEMDYDTETTFLMMEDDEWDNDSDNEGDPFYFD